MKIRMLLFLPFAVIAAVASILAAAPAKAAPATRQVSPVELFGTTTQVAGAWAALVRDDTGVAMTLHTTGLTPGDVVTVWWMIFNNPRYCTHGGSGAQCGPGDLPPSGDPRVDASVMYGTGHVIGGQGATGYGAHLAVGQLTGVVLFGPGLLRSRAAEIHLIVLDHGPAKPGIIDQEIHGKACNPTCTDVQDAIFAPKAQAADRVGQPSEPGPAGAGGDAPTRPVLHRRAHGLHNRDQREMRKVGFDRAPTRGQCLAQREQSAADLVGHCPRRGGDR